MKKIFLITLLFSILSLVHAQDKITIRVPSYDENGKIIESVYQKDFPDNYNDAISTINTLLDVYNEVSSNYKEQLENNEELINNIIRELKDTKTENAELKRTIEATEQTEESVVVAKDSIKKVNSSLNLGVVGEYGFLGDSNEVSVQFGIQLWKFTFLIGPNILIPKSFEKDSVKFGLRAGVGFWF